MAVLTPVTPLRDGALSPGVAVAASDTININVMGPNGVYLEVINGNAASDTVGISDHGTTDAGSPLPSNQFTKAVGAGTSQVFHIRRDQVNPATGLVTVTHSVTATVTCKLYPH